jgi:NAD(P)-dependent dehydrogenase (short-subunit alcohol dehydrogenase family)
MKTAIVTGVYGAIGRAIAEGLAREGLKVMLVGRDPARLLQLKKELLQAAPAAELSAEPVDLSSKKEIEAFSKRFNAPLHILVNNAATAPRRRTESRDGIEMQFAANVLGYYWMIRYFSPFMEKAEDARIVNVASYWAGGLDLRDPEFKIRPYDNDTAYRQSKQADRMLAAAFAARLEPLGITVNACHPGDVNSKLSNVLGFGGIESPRQGAATPLWLALSPAVKGITGRYFADKSPQPCEFMRDGDGVEKLYQLCSSY